MKENGKQANTFIVKIIDQQNSTWQGSITWVEEKKEQKFRSVLELIKLVDGALETQEEKDPKGGEHEEH